MPSFSEISVADLRLQLDETQAELQERIEAYDERAALQQPYDSDNKAIDRRAYEALQRSEQFHGEHAVAMAWLKQSRTARIWRSNRGR